MSGIVKRDKIKFFVMVLWAFTSLSQVYAESIDDQNSAIIYSQSPMWYPNSNLNTGIWRNGTAKSSPTIYSYVVYTHPNSTRIKWFATKGPDRGSADVYIDDVFKIAVDQYAPTLKKSSSVFDSGVLPPGSHTIKIIHNGRKNSRSSNSWIEVDGFDVTISNIAQIKVMPLGDSITYGYIDGVQMVTGGYRKPLWDLLKKENLNIDFVGSQKNGTLDDKDHEGYPMYRIDQITDLVDNKGIMSVKPQYVLLHIGTNDALQNFQMWSIETRISYLIDRVLANMQTGGKLYVAQIPLCGFFYYIANMNILNYNNILAKVVGEKKAQGKPVVLVDMFNSVTVYDLADQIHPTAYGYQKMANTWFNAIKNDLKNSSSNKVNTAYPYIPDGNKFEGFNIFAPEVVWRGSKWFMYYGGWLEQGDTNDKNYLISSKDANFSGSWTMPRLNVTHGDWQMVNDPTVVQASDKNWYMLYTLGNLKPNPTTAHIFDEWIGYSTSIDGKVWTPNAGSNSSKIVLTDLNKVVSNGTITGIARPSLVKKKKTWYLYFDGCVNGCVEMYSFVATSTAISPTSFNVVHKIPNLTGFPGFMEPDVHVKKDGTFIAVANGYYTSLYYGTSKDGLNYTMNLLFNASDVGLKIISNPSLIVDKNDTLIGVAYSGSEIDSAQGGMMRNKIYFKYIK